MSKFAENCGFLSPEAHTMNTFRQNFAGKCRHCVCYSTPNLAIIGKNGVGTGALQSVKICPKLSFLATGSRHNERIQMKFGV